MSSGRLRLGGLRSTARPRVASGRRVDRDHRVVARGRAARHARVGRRAGTEARAHHHAVPADDDRGGALAGRIALASIVNTIAIGSVGVASGVTSIAIRWPRKPSPAASGPSRIEIADPECVTDVSTGSEGVAPSPSASVVTESKPARALERERRQLDRADVGGGALRPDDAPLVSRGSCGGRSSVDRRAARRERVGGRRAAVVLERPSCGPAGRERGRAAAPVAVEVARAVEPAEAVAAGIPRRSACRRPRPRRRARRRYCR